MRSRPGLAMIPLVLVGLLMSGRCSRRPRSPQTVNNNLTKPHEVPAPYQPPSMELEPPETALAHAGIKANDPGYLDSVRAARTGAAGSGAAGQMNSLASQYGTGPGPDAPRAATSFNSYAGQAAGGTAAPAGGSSAGAALTGGAPAGRAPETYPGARGATERAPAAVSRGGAVPSAGAAPSAGTAPALGRGGSAGGTPQAGGAPATALTPGSRAGLGDPGGRRDAGLDAGGSPDPGGGADGAKGGSSGAAPPTAMGKLAGMAGGSAGGSSGGASSGAATPQGKPVPGQPGPGGAQPPPDRAQLPNQRVDNETAGEQPPNPHPPAADPFRDRPFPEGGSTFSGVRATVYHPGIGNSRIEGGPKDRFGQPLCRAEQFARGQCHAVTIAIDQRLQIQRGARVRSPELDAAFKEECRRQGITCDRPLELAVNDTGACSHFRGPRHIDVATGSDHTNSFGRALNRGSVTIQFEQDINSLRNPRIANTCRD